MTSALTIIMTFLLGVFLAVSFCCLAFGWLFKNQSFRYNFFPHLSTKFPVDFQKHCPACGDAALKAAPLPQLVEPEEVLWQKGQGDGVFFWAFQRVTRVTGFELRGDTSGFVTSIQVSGAEQLAIGAVRMVALNGVSITLSVMVPGELLEFRYVNFTGEIRPLLEQVQ